MILQKKVAALSEASLDRFVQRARRAAGLRGVANVLVTSSDAVRALNRQFRGQNKATDVLSFPFPVLTSASRRSRTALGGDISISADVAAQNAALLGHSAADEVKILTLHGILHLAGFDHERDNGAMARKEMKLRQRLKLPPALIERAQPGRRKSLKKARGKTRATKARRTT